MGGRGSDSGSSSNSGNDNSNNGSNDQGNNNQSQSDNSSNSSNDTQNSENQSSNSNDQGKNDTNTNDTFLDFIADPNDDQAGFSTIASDDSVQMMIETNPFDSGTLSEWLPNVADYTNYIFNQSEAKSIYQNAVNSEGNSPSNNDNIRSDFFVSFVLFSTNEGAFKSEYPERYAAISNIQSRWF